MKNILKIFIIVLLTISFVFAVNIPHPVKTPIQHIKWYSGHYVNGIQQTVKWESNKYLYLSGALAIPAAFLLDDAINDFAYDHGFFSDNISHIGDVYAHRWGYVAIELGIMANALVRQQDFTYTFTQLEIVGESVLTSAIICEGIKRLSKRTRPNGNNTMSFPSGHTTGAFTVAANLNNMFGPKIGIPAYMMAGFVGLTRINDHNHYFSDVVAGAFLGTLIGRSFSIQHKLDWSVEVTNNKTGISLGYSF